MLTNIFHFSKLYTIRHTLFVKYNRALFSTKNKPGKKSQADPKTEPSSSEETEEHLFNIYSSVAEDHSMLADEHYPSWLWDLDKPDKTYGELMQMFLYGKNIEKAKMADYNRFCRLHNRNRIKLNNIRLQRRRKVSMDSNLWNV